MKKLNVLKTLVDVFWLFALITTPIMLLIVGYGTLQNSSDISTNSMISLFYKDFKLSTKLILLSTAIIYFIIAYSIFQFRKILKEFQKTEVFSDLVLNGFHKMGLALIIASTLSGSTSFLYALIVKQKLALSFSFSPFMLMLCFGLFFMILSEVFKIAKQAKEENELTV